MTRKQEKNAGEEPYVATGRGGALIAVWDQDLGTGVTAAVSRDGGSSWKQHPLPFTNCRSDELESGTSDQWAAIGPDGRMYVSALASWDTAVAATSSKDTGRKWGSVRTIDFGSEIDKPTIAADARRAGEAYISFSDFSKGRHTYTALLSRTTDGGKSWTHPATILRRKTGENEKGAIPELVVDPHTDRLYFSAFFLKWDMADFTLLTASDDGGRTWSRARQIVENNTRGIDGFKVGNDTRIAIDPRNGTLYAMWMDARFRNMGFDDVLLSRSTDHGLRWSKPTRVTTAPGGGLIPSIAVNADGILGVTYYAPAKNPLYSYDSSDLPISYWFVSSSDGGKHFSRPLHLAGPFNFANAPRPQFDYFIGDYEGLAATGNGFHPVFVVLRKGKPSPHVLTTTIQP